VAGLGTLAGAVYVTEVDVPPVIVPNVGLPFVTPFTFQVRAVFVVPVTDAVIAKVLLTCTLGEPVGLVMETDTGGAIVTWRDADFEVSAWLVTAMLNVAGLGTEAGAVYVTDKPEPLIVPNVVLPPATPFTFHVTAVFEVPDTDAVIANV